MTHVVGIRALTRAKNLRFGKAVATPTQTVLVDLDDLNRRREVARHASIGAVTSTGVSFNYIPPVLTGWGTAQGGKVTANGTNLTLSFTAGTVRRPDGTTVALNAGTVNVGTADATNPRRDFVVSDTAGTVTVVAGTAAVYPILPTLTAGQIALAEVLVPATATAIPVANVTDKRVALAY